MTTHYLDVVCPNCGQLLSVPVRVGVVFVQPKSVALGNIEAKVSHQCRKAAPEIPLEDQAASEDGAS